ncbi:membrane protein [Nibribacter koreensis]|uniref:Membrane protein n=1 Tax=Nibribacter koreensis TaxID=1084519 RepID=A0ABP8FQJ4_9BACT
MGDVVQGTGGVRNFGMGNVGVGTANMGSINDINPALLYYNNMVNFEAAVISELKKLEDRTASQVDGKTNLNYLALSIPITRRWTASLGLKPYSRVNYNTIVVTPVNDPSTGNKVAQSFTEYSGSGGLNEVHFSHGVSLAPGLTLGASGSYIFGTIEKAASTILVEEGETDISAVQKALVNNTTKYTGFMLKGGTHYRRKLTDKFHMGLGATYSAQSVLDADRQVSQERRRVDESIVSQVLVDSLDGHTTLPQQLQVGIAVDNAKNFVVGADFSSYKGSDFRGFSSEKNAGRQEQGDGYRIGLGGELTPDAGSVSSYFKRVTYRLGGYYSANEVMATTGAQEVKDMGLTWGFTFPLGRGVRPPDYTQAVINTSFAVGKLEGTQTQLEEMYFRVNIGINFNSRWFIKRRFD